MKHLVIISILVLVVGCDRPATRPTCPCVASQPPRENNVEVKTPAPAPVRAEATSDARSNAMVYALVTVDRMYSPPVDSILNSYSMRVLEPRRSDLISVLFGGGNVRLGRGELFVAEIDTKHPREDCFLGASQGDVIRMIAVKDQAQGMDELAKIARGGWVAAPDRDISPNRDPRVKKRP